MTTTTTMPIAIAIAIAIARPRPRPRVTRLPPLPSSSHLASRSLARELTTSPRLAARPSAAPYDQGTQGNENGKEGKEGKEKLVILGSGWGGYSLLQKLDKSRYDVYLVSPNTYFAFTPLLAQCAVGTLEFRCALEPVRSTPNVHFHHAWCDAIDTTSQTLTLMPAYPPAFREVDPLTAEQQQGTLSAGSPPIDPALAKSQQAQGTAAPGQQGQRARVPETRGGYNTSMARPPHHRLVESSEAHEEDASEKHHSQAPGETWKSQEHGREYELKYDKLVVAVGAYNATFGIKGVKDNAWFLKDVQNARAIRWRILECLEQAGHPSLTDTERRQLLHFVCVGGGPTGSEFAAELHDLVSSDLPKIFPSLVPLIKISLLDASGGILNNFDASLAEYARKKFARDGIEVKVNRTVKGVEKGKLIVEPDGEIPFGLLVWSTGICASPLVNSLEQVSKDPKTKSILTDTRLRAMSSDAPEAGSGSGSVLSNVFAIGDCAVISNEALPATAQVATQKGLYLAKILNARAGSAQESEEFRFVDRGSMASLGSGRAIVDLPRNKEAGRLAFVFWRSAYTYMSMSWRNRILVPFYWAINSIFGRDIARF